MLYAENTSTNLLFAQLNINSLRNTFEFLVHIVRGCADILLICESKFDERFPMSQFKIEGINAPFRADCDNSRGGIMLHVREDTLAKLLTTEKLPIEGFYIELNLRNQKWLASCSYNPKKTSIDQPTQRH